MAQHNKLLFNSWTNVVSTIRNELVFEGRNKDYGAYQIRRNYNRTLSVALAITIGAIVLTIAVPKIIDLITGAMEEEMTVAVDLSDVVTMEPPPIDETEPPPPPPPPPPPVAATVKFVPPVIDDEAPEEEPPPIQETETQIATVTNEGSGDEVLIVDETPTVVEPVEEEIFTIVEEMPTFPGGDAEMLKFLRKNINYPPMEQEAGIQGTVYVSFVVDKEGKVTDVKVVRGVASGPNLAKEAERVVKMMPPWKVGKQNGRPVKVSYSIPIKFSLK